MELGLLIAYLALGTMAVLPIYYGSYAGLKLPKQPAKKGGKKGDESESDTKKGGKKGDESESESDSDEEPEFFRFEDAYWFPVFGSLALLSLYLVFKYLNKEYLNALFTAYFSILGIGATLKAFLAVSRKVTGWKIKGEYRVDMWKQKTEIASYHFGTYHLFLIVVSVVIAGLYAMTKHWILNNIYGEAFSVSAVSLLNLDSFKTGMALLAFLFVYDIFWVFGTDVMVTVAKGFDAPVKVLFPKDIFEVLGGNWFKPEGVQFTLLGLGDIVIPGIFVALCLQFDHHRYLKSPASKKHPRSLAFPKPYFTACFIAYALGLITTVVVMHNFQAAQPALLYLSPACILSVLITGLARGELKQVFNFSPEDRMSAKKTLAHLADEFESTKTKKGRKAVDTAEADTFEEIHAANISGDDMSEPLLTSPQRRSKRKSTQKKGSKK